MGRYQSTWLGKRQQDRTCAPSPLTRETVRNLSHPQQKSRGIHSFWKRDLCRNQVGLHLDKITEELFEFSIREASHLGSHPCKGNNQTSQQHLTHAAVGFLDTNAEVFPFTKAKWHAVTGSSSAERGF